MVSCYHRTNPQSREPRYPRELTDFEKSDEDEDNVNDNNNNDDYDDGNNAIKKLTKPHKENCSTKG